ncbi:ArsR/SmtB family transcription factor [Actinacidiphila yeochonensis]|uniref:ArsR/SmtB family transcription factor n=1 Tax=Actinacidiphila yeochonensis TaxID=89050 RepID=UPI00055E8673|nr:metalloregulator ArsR/SmtB family transcription factor [Actinacidiphila yeochonensis]
MRTPSHPRAEEIELASLFHAFSDPVRLAIVGLVATSELSCGAMEIPLSKSTLSHHLKILREAGVTSTRIEGTHRFISVRHDDLNARFPGLVDAILAQLPHSPLTLIGASG